MNKIIYLLLYSILILSCTQIKYKKKIFYDNYWRVTDSTSADFFRVINYNDKDEIVGYIKDYYITGEIQSEKKLSSLGEEINGDVYDDCTYKSFYKNNQIENKGNYKENKKVGEWKSYYDNGNTQWAGKYANGNLEGESRSYYEDGKIKQISNHSKGITNGKIKFYYENGQLAWDGYYVDGKKEGPWIFYEKDGSVRWKGKLKNNEPIE